MKKVALSLVAFLLILGGLAISAEEVEVPFEAIKSSCYGEIDMTKAEFPLSEVSEECVQEEWLEANFSQKVVLEVSPKLSGTIEYRDVGFRWTGRSRTGSNSDLQYSYKLGGKNSSWSPWSSNTNKLYPNLSDGDYTFKVRAKNGNGKTYTKTITFRVEPLKYWEDKWAQDPNSERTKRRVEKPEEYNIQGLRINADFKVDLGNWYDSVKEKTYWVPAASLGAPDNTSEEIFDLKGKPEQAKDKINVLYEALVFIHLNLKIGIHNAKTRDQDNIRWEFPKPAKPAIRDGEVNCASTANVIKYLLEDDYDEVGYVWRARDRDSDDPGGHGTSYIKHNGKYYFFDPVSLAVKKSHYPVENGDGRGYHVDRADHLIQSKPENYAIYWTQRSTRDEAIFAINTAESNNFALGDKGDKYYYPKAFDGSRLTIWLDPEDTEELLEAPYSPEPPTNQYNVKNYADYPPYDEYLEPVSDQVGKPEIKTMPTDD